MCLELLFLCPPYKAVLGLFPICRSPGQVGGRCDERSKKKQGGIISAVCGSF